VSTPHDSATPVLSVIVASVNGQPMLGKCLAALLDQDSDLPYEIVVADRCGGAVAGWLAEQPDPRVRSVAAPPASSIPHLRALGMAAARAPLVAILEDHCNVVPGWVRVLVAARRAGHLAIGGAVENGARERAIDWAVFFCEYARFMPPVAGGVVDEITGNNSAYDRPTLEALGIALDQEVWEGFLHAELRRAGVAFYCEPELLVWHEKQFGFAYFLAQRYHYSRSFAGERLRGASPWRRLAYAVATAGLPPLLAWRLVRTVLAKGGRRRELLRALPFLPPFLLAWAWGEAVGALRGPGQSLEKVE
jgi:glycosyltransferase involved in cell wall biosynthesis